MIQRTKPKYSSVKLFLCFFSFLVLYNFFVINRCRFPLADSTQYEFHAVDFSMGFCTKILPGAIFNFFVKEPTVLKATIYESILLLLFFAGISALFCAVYRRIPRENEPAFFTVCAFFLSGPCTFGDFSYRLGMLDVYWLFFAAIFFVCVKQRYARWLIPLLAALSVFVHFGALISYILLYAIILLYEASHAENQKEKNIYLLIFGVTCIAAIGTFAYFIVFEEQNLRYSFEEFGKLLESRNSQFYYYTYSLYRQEDLGMFGMPPETISEYLTTNDISASAFFLSKIINQIKLHFWMYFEFGLIKSILYPAVLLLFLSPILVPIYKFLLAKLKAEKENKLSVFSLFCASVLLPFVLCVSLLVSTDSSKWLTHSFLMLLSFYLYLQYRENGKGLDTLTAYLRKDSHVLIFIYYTVYFFSFTDPYL